MATIRSRRLGRALQQLRVDAGLDREEVARELECSVRTLERTEKGSTVPSVPDFESMLALYGGTTPDQAAVLRELRKNAKRRGWWAAFGDVLDGTYVGFEDEAQTIRSFQAQVIPGLLQTEEYSRAILDAVRPDDPEGNEVRVRARMARKPLLRRADPPAPDLYVVLDEAALRRQVGSPAIMRAQLSELWSASQKPNIRIQIVPFTAGAHAGAQGSFVILSFGPYDPDVIYVEGRAGDLYPESAKAINTFNLDWERLLKVSLSPQESAEMLADMTKE